MALAELEEGLAEGGLGALAGAALRGAELCAALFLFVEQEEELQGSLLLRGGGGSGSGHAEGVGFLGEDGLFVPEQPVPHGGGALAGGLPERGKMGADPLPETRKGACGELGGAG